MKPHPIYIMRLQAEPGIDAPRALRWLLKAMLRQYRLRCISLVEERGHE